MATRVVLVIAIVAVVSLIALVMERTKMSRRKPVRTAAPVPMQVDRSDFARPQAPFLALLFSSTNCESCVAMRDRFVAVASDAVAFAECDFAGAPQMHEKYAIESVPVAGLYDSAGVALLTWVGSVRAEEIWSGIHEAVSHLGPD